MPKQTDHIALKPRVDELAALLRQHYDCEAKVLPVICGFAIFDIMLMRDGHRIAYLVVCPEPELTTGD